MSSNFTRRSFLGSATTAGVLAQGAIESAPSFAQGIADAPQRRRGFDEGWRFTRGDFPGAEQVSFDDRGWRVLDLPHDWSVEGPFSETEPAGGNGGYLPTGIGWYRKSFTLPASDNDKRIRIEFDGVYQRSEVWINGHRLGMRPFGFNSFGYDLTTYLNQPGQANLVAVRVDNSLQPNCRWYSGSGIYRHVWLIATDPVHVAPWGLQVITPLVSADAATVEVSTRVLNDGVKPMTCVLETEILDSDGTVLQTVSAKAEIAAKGEHLFVHRVHVTNPALWSVETPALYSARSTARTDGGSDIEGTAFGIRSIHFDADNGFLLNGQHLKLNGVCLHGDAGAVGTAVPERMWESRLAKLKEMGCNAIRCSHNPPAPEFLDLCDRMGVLVMGEPFDEWRHPKPQTSKYGYHKYFDEWWKRDLTDMVMRDRNHPSIVIWSAGNEVPDQTWPEGPETLEKIMAVYHRMDPTRPVTAACDKIAADPKPTPQTFLEKLDVVGHNYVDRWRDRREKYYSVDRHAFPHRRFIGTESTSMGGTRGVYPPTPDIPGGRGFASNTRIQVEQLQKFVQTYDYVSGDFMWTGIDYIGEARWPNKSSTAGVIDTCGFPKDGFYFYQSQWTKKPMLYLFPHWSWPGREGKAVTVTCYTNCDTVELFLNGESLGSRGYAFPRPGMTETYGHFPDRARALQTTADLHLTWDVLYMPGTLKAVGTKDGQPVATYEVVTAGHPAALRLTADRDEITTERGDVAHVMVEVLDARGIIVPTAADQITFALSGEGRLIGVDNGQPDSHESYQGSQRRAFNGLALALVQSNGKPGSMTLIASAPSLTDAKTEISAT